MPHPVDAVVAFTHVARLRSYARAAQVLGVSASTLSRRVAALEASAGLRLLERTTRQVRLTEAGQVYFQQCQVIERELEEASRVLEGLSEHSHGRLVASVSTALAGGLIASVAGRFVAENPGVNVTVRVEDRVVDLMREGVDVAVRAGQHLDDSSHLHARKLGESVPILCATPGYLAEHGRPTNPADLRRHHLFSILWDDQGTGTNVDWPLVHRRREIHFTAPARALVGSFDCLRSITLTGAGISLLPASFCAELLRQGKLARASPTLAAQPFRLFAVTLGRVRLPAKIKRFVELLVEEARTAPELNDAT